MKKLLSIAFCAAAAFAASAETASTALVTVGVIPVTLPAGQANTIIAAAFTGLEGGELTIANVVKTTNLAAGDQILLFKDGGYTAWVLGDDKKWNATDANFTLDSAGNTTVTTGAETSTTVTAGQGLWIVRKDATDAATIAIYGKFVDSPTTTVAANTWTLVGNAGIKDLTFSEGESRMQIITVVNGKLREYNYSTKKKSWWYNAATDGGDQDVKWESPTITPGFGFWIKTPTEKTIRFVNE